MAKRKTYSEPPLEVDWSVYVVHPSHPRPKDEVYHDVMGVLSHNEPRSASLVRKLLPKPYKSSEISQALRLLVQDEFAQKAEGQKYVLV